MFISEVVPDGAIDTSKVFLKVEKYFSAIFYAKEKHLRGFCDTVH